jgi:hypothetical protein
MRMRNILAWGLVAVVAMATLDPAAARSKKKRLKTYDAPIARDFDGTPIIMQGFRRTRPTEDLPARQADKPVRIPRGSSTYIPEPNPSPSGGPPARALVQPPPTQVYRPPPINSFSDRVTNCIHSYPLNKGIGLNPTDQQAYIRQCAN